MKRARCQEQAEQPSPKGHGRKSVTSLSICQTICHWLLWLVVVLLALFLPSSAVVLEAGAESQVTTSESLLAPIVRHGDAAGLFFPWRLSRSRQRRTIRLPVWASYLLGLYALFRQMSSWNMLLRQSKRSCCNTEFILMVVNETLL